METLAYTTNIKAPSPTVWKMMTGPDTYKEWVGVAFPGSRYEGTWEEGTEIRFVGDDGSGTLARLTHVEPNRVAESEHIAILRKGGTVDTTSEEARNWTGMRENYYLEEIDGGTRIRVEMHVRPEWKEMFDESFPTILTKLKEMCERQATPA